MEPIKVVLRFIDGKVLKGVSRDFYPDRERFHMVISEDPANRETEVLLSDLKAVFIVRDFKGDPKYREQKDFSNGAKIYGQKVEVTFADGEVLVGSTLGPGRGIKRKGFFLFPADAKSNVLRAFLFSSAIKKVRPLQHSEFPPSFSKDAARLPKNVSQIPSRLPFSRFSRAERPDQN